MSGWVNAMSRLPLDIQGNSSITKEVKVIATDGVDVCIKIFRVGCLDLIGHYRQWDFGGDIDGNDIIAWMPLPEPPKKPEAEFNTKQEG